MHRQMKTDSAIALCFSPLRVIETHSRSNLRAEPPHYRGAQADKIAVTASEKESIRYYSLHQPSVSRDGA